MGAVLQQEQFGTVCVVAYASKTFDASERMYCTTRKELAAVNYALKEFRHYVLGGKLFLLRTDHGALTSLFKVPVPIPVPIPIPVPRHSCAYTTGSVPEFLGRL